MRKILVLVILFVVIIPAIAKESDSLNSKSSNFLDLGRYIETLETNEDFKKKPTIIQEDEEFEEEAIKEVVRRYEENAVELRVDEVNETALNEVNSDRIFKLKINETQYNIEQGIKNENMIWDSSKAFSQSFINGSRHLAPIPSVINASTVTANVSPSITASLGQTYLYDANGPSVLFVRTNESTYNTGSVLSYKGDFLNLSVGSFSSSYNHASSGGAILSSNSINLPKNCGNIVIGGAYFSNEGEDTDKVTSGGFVEYTFKRLKLNAQVGESKYINSNNYDTSLYLIPELKLSKSISLKTRLIRNVSQDTMQDELVLSYKPVKNKHNLEIELNATNQYTNNSTIKQRLKLSTSFKI
jgi:hypothetical protein